MSTIIVLGGGGFLADYVELHYLELGWRVVSVGRGAMRSSSDFRYAWNLPHNDFTHLLAIEQPELCVNATGKASVPASVVEPLADFEANTVLNYYILDSIRRISPHTIFIHLSSAAVYGNPLNLPVNETADIKPISPYGWHKYLSEVLVEEHASMFGIHTASLRIFSAYGVGLKRQVVWDLTVKALNTVDGPLSSLGCSDDSRDFIHARDIATAIELIANNGELHGEVYNVANGEEVPIGLLARKILNQMGQSKKIIFDGNRVPGNPSRWHADISKLKALGFHPEVAFESGLNKIIELARNTA